MGPIVLAGVVAAVIGVILYFNARKAGTWKEVRRRGYSPALTVVSFGVPLFAIKPGEEIFALAEGNKLRFLPTRLLLACTTSHKELSITIEVDDLTEPPVRIEAPDEKRWKAIIRLLEEHIGFK